MKKRDCEYLSNKMSIDMDWFLTELNSKSLVASKQKIECFISKSIRVIENERPTEEILQAFKEAGLKTTNQKTIDVLDGLRHAFHTFKKGGLLDLYERQENASWHLKVTIKRELKPNDISGLTKSILIYRGCNISEFHKKKYGQSWSTSRQIAEKFAYEAYKTYSWFSIEKRCVLQATIKSKYVYFSNQTKSEKEIVVNTTKLDEVIKSNP